MSGSSHTIGVKDCSNLRVLPVLLHWGCCLDVGPQRKLALMSKLTPPSLPSPQAGRAASRLPCGFGSLKWKPSSCVYSISVRGGRVGGWRQCALPAGHLRCLTDCREREFWSGLFRHHTNLVSKPYPAEAGSFFLWLSLLDSWSSLLSTSRSSLEEAISCLQGQL